MLIDLKFILMDMKLPMVFKLQDLEEHKNRFHQQNNTKQLLLITAFLLLMIFIQP